MQGEMKKGGESQYCAQHVIGGLSDQWGCPECRDGVVLRELLMIYDRHAVSYGLSLPRRAV